MNFTGMNLGFSSAGSGSDGNGNYNDYLLSGTLQNGQSITGVHLHDYIDGGLDVGDPNAGTGNLRFAAGNAAAPEPSSVAFLCISGLSFAGVALRRRKN